MGLFVLPFRHFRFIGVLLGKRGNHLLGFTFGAVHNNLNANQQLIKVLGMWIDGKKLLSFGHHLVEGQFTLPSLSCSWVEWSPGYLFHSTLKVIHKGNTCLVPVWCLMLSLTLYAKWVIELGIKTQNWGPIHMVWSFTQFKFYGFRFYP